jgi:hypothetical protein
MLSSLRPGIRGFLKLHFEVDVPGLSPEENKKWTESAAQSATAVFMLGLGVTYFLTKTAHEFDRYIHSVPWLMIGLFSLSVFRAQPLAIKQVRFWVANLCLVSFFGVTTGVPLSGLLSGPVEFGLRLAVASFLVAFGLALHKDAAQREASRRLHATPNNKPPA